MIYNSTINSINESGNMSLLESVENRFEDCTMAEATATIVAEQEINWNRFMKGVGLSELNTIIEGEEVIYEGAKLDKFMKKVKGYFEMVKQKIAEITKAFIAKISQIFKSNDTFVKKYEKELLAIDIPKDFEYKGYNFKNENLDTNPPFKNIANNIPKNTEIDREGMQDKVFTKGVPNESSFNEKLVAYFYGNKEKTKLDINKDFIKKQINILKETKKLKSDATKSYKDAVKTIDGFIEDLKKSMKDQIENPADKSNIEDSNANYNKSYNVLNNYKALSQAMSQMHGAYLRALGARNRQAKSICTSLIVKSGKAKGKEDRKEIRSKMEGFVDTDAFLGAIEYI